MSVTECGERVQGPTDIGATERKSSNEQSGPGRTRRLCPIAEEECGGAHPDAHVIGLVLVRIDGIVAQRPCNTPEIHAAQSTVTSDRRSCGPKYTRGNGRVPTARRCSRGNSRGLLRHQEGHPS